MIQINLSHEIDLKKLLIVKQVVVMKSNGQLSRHCSSDSDLSSSLYQAIQSSSKFGDNLFYSWR
jgi:hypothetical protein